jgi:hypothetical protein
MKIALVLLMTLALLAGAPVAHARGDREVPELDHVFVIVLENHNSFTSFGSIGILDNPKAPQITRRVMAPLSERWADASR